jgi:hypothetical protein
MEQTFIVAFHFDSHLSDADEDGFREAAERYEHKWLMPSAYAIKTDEPLEM